ncbi:MAG: Gmad2 immunoglobulin-like domain-containing protein, partial [Nocardioidaceae bacterium]
GTPIANSPSQEPRTGDLTQVFPVTYIGPADNGWRLVTELHMVDAQDQADVAAVREFLTGQPADPDYRTGWPTLLDVESVTRADGQVLVSLTGPAGALSADPALPAKARDMAVQALLRTAGARVGEQAGFTFNGEPLTSVLGVDLPVTVASDEDVRAFISLPRIVDGAPYADAHDDAPVKVEVSGNVFEGTVNWELHDSNGEIIDEGFVTTAFMEWRSATINLGRLEPGTYTLQAFEVSMEDGSRLMTEDKTFEIVP